MDYADGNTSQAVTPFKSFYFNEIKVNPRKNNLFLYSSDQKSIKDW